MNEAYVLINAISLLYWQNVLNYNYEITKNEVIELIDNYIKSPANLTARANDKETIDNLKSVILWMIESIYNKNFDKTLLLQRVRLAIVENDELYESFSISLSDTNDAEEVRRRIRGYEKVINEYRNRIDLKKILGIGYNQLLTEGDEVNISNIAQSLIPELMRLEENSSIREKGSSPAIINVCDFSDDKEIVDKFRSAQDDVKPEAVLKTGYQGINRMLGKDGGFRRGETIVIGALRFNYKTGLTLDFAVDVPHVNIPYMYDNTKIPLILYISTENSMSLNLRLMEKRIYEQKYNVSIDPDELEPEFASSMVKEYVEKNGYKFIFMELNSTETNYVELIKILDFYQNDKNYEIHLLAIDYLATISKDNVKNSSKVAGAEIRELFRIMRNYCRPKKITLLTPHQISTEAIGLKRQGVKNFIKEVVNKLYWDSCKSLDQEIDVDIQINVERYGGKDYLSCGRGKDRGSPNTPEEDKFCYLVFNSIGGIIMDFFGKDLSLRKLSGSDDIDLDPF